MHSMPLMFVSCGAFRGFCDFLPSYIRGAAQDTFIVRSPISCPKNVTVAWSPHPQHTGSTVSQKYSSHDVSLSTLTNLSSGGMSLLLGSLFGITCVQVYIYYGKNFKDRLLFKLVVHISVVVLPKLIVWGRLLSYGTNITLFTGAASSSQNPGFLTPST